MENRSIEVNALDRFRDNLNLFINHHMENHLGKDWRSNILIEINYKPIIESKSLDLPPLVEIFHQYWDTVFKSEINSSFPKAVLTIIKYFRNCSAHQQILNTRELYRMLDLMCWALDEMHLHDSVLNEFRLNVLIKLAEEETYQLSRIHHSGPPIRNENEFRSPPSSIQYSSERPTREQQKLSNSQTQDFSSLYQNQAREVRESASSTSSFQSYIAPTCDFHQDFTHASNHSSSLNSSNTPLNRVSNQLGLYIHSSTCDVY